MRGSVVLFYWLESMNETLVDSQLVVVKVVGGMSHTLTAASTLSGFYYK